MRLLLLFLSLCVLIAFGQSKKELRLELEKVNKKADSLNKVLLETTLNHSKKVDSLQFELKQKEAALKQKQYVLEGAIRQTENLKKYNEELKEELRFQQNNKTSKSSSKSSNPFLLNGPSGANGSGSQSVGNDGNGGPGTGMSMRKRVSSVDASQIKSVESGKIVFIISVDVNGDVIEVLVDKAKTTILNQTTLNQAKELVKSQVKYNPDLDQPVYKTYLTLQITAS